MRIMIFFLLSATAMALEVNGVEVVKLETKSSKKDRPHFVSADLIPGRGMNVFQIRAFLPGKGEVDLLASPSLEEAKKIFEKGGSEDFNGNLSFYNGGAILYPYANRVEGKYLPESKEIETNILGKKIRLPANWKGKKEGAPWHAMHGLILNKRVQPKKITSSRYEGELRAGDLNKHWLSESSLLFSVILTETQFILRVTATNAGKENLPVGIGWHPYFAFPSGHREQVKVFLPAEHRVLVSNYDDVFPTGKFEAVKGTPYDFSKEGGKELGSQYLDDCFFDFKKRVAEIRDPQAHYGIRIEAKSPQIKALQVYSPPDKNFVAIEPQFNLADPFGPEWPKDFDTGMVVSKPGNETTYSVALSLFEMK